MIIYCPRVFITWRMLKLRENGLNIDYMYETNSVLRKTAETEISDLAFWLGSVRVFINRNRTEIRFPHIPSGCTNDITIPRKPQVHITWWLTALKHEPETRFSKTNRSFLCCKMTTSVYTSQCAWTGHYWRYEWPSKPTIWAKYVDNFALHWKRRSKVKEKQKQVNLKSVHFTRSSKKSSVNTDPTVVRYRTQFNAPAHGRNNWN